MEDRFTIVEAHERLVLGDRVASCQLVHKGLIGKAFEVQDVSQGREVVNAARLHDVKVPRPIAHETSHALDLRGDNLGWQDFRVIYHVEELYWQVVLHVQNCALVQEVVEVELFYVGVAPQD